MIDSIILRVHNLQRNKNLVKSLYNFTSKGYDTEVGEVSVSDLVSLNNKGIKDPMVIIETLKYKNKMERKGKFILKTQVGKQINQSNHYMFTFFINYSKDYVEFNFSIPKYKYGTNIFLFIRHQLDKGFIFHNATTLESNMKESYELLTTFLKRLFHWEFLMCKVDFKDVEVNRIDVCFNQVFKSKSDALLYLEYQKRLKKKYAREEEGVMREYATSLMYVTKRYSAKIYHKGSEYASNDLKEHLKYNKEKKTNYFKTEKLQVFADRILRYELTLRNPFFNYIHKQHIFRKKDAEWQELSAHYHLAEAIKQKNERISKKIGSLKTQQEKDDYISKHPYGTISQQSKVAHKIVSKIISRSRYFKLDTDFDSDLFNKVVTTYNDDNVFFSKQLFELCLKKLVDFIKEFQVKELESEEIIKRKIEAHNAAYPSKKLPLSEMIIFYSHLLKHGSFKDAAKFCSYSRATLFRYMLRFKILGIDDKSIRPAEKSFGIPAAPLNLREYHIHVNDNRLLKDIRVTEASRI